MHPSSKVEGNIYTCLARAGRVEWEADRARKGGHETGQAGGWCGCLRVGEVGRLEVSEGPDLLTWSPKAHAARNRQGGTDAG